MPRVISSEIKEKILHLSRNNYLRQGEIAKMCGVSRPMVNALLNGRDKVRTRKVAKQTGVYCPITGFYF